MPTNMYGPGDNYDLENAHVLPALIRRFHEAKKAEASSVQLWGTGAPRREFLHSDDLGRASLFLLQNYDDDIPINVGTGEDIPIKDLAELVRNIVGYTGEIEWDLSKPDGTPRKLLDISRIAALGWSAEIPLEKGIKSTYELYQNHG